MEMIYQITNSLMNYANVFRACNAFVVQSEICCNKEIPLPYCDDDLLTSEFVCDELKRFQILMLSDNLLFLHVFILNFCVYTDFFCRKFL